MVSSRQPSSSDQPTPTESWTDGATAFEPGKYVGQNTLRLEDKPLLTGRGRFAADVSFADQLHMRVVRSPVARGRLLKIDTSKATALDGVVAAWTHQDVAEIPPITFRIMRVDDLEPFRQPILSDTYVRYVGEPVAVVFARDPYLAEDAEELVAVEIEPLEPYLDARADPGEFEPGRIAEATVIHKEYGDLDRAFADCHQVIELDFAIAPQSGVPLETRGAIVRWNAAVGILEFYGAAKVPHQNRIQLSTMLGLPLNAVHLFEGHVGGGFGVRGEIYPEDVLASVAAMRLGRPIKWIEDRRESLIATNHSRDQKSRIRAAVDSRGFILGLDVQYWAGQGGYIRTHGVTVHDMAAAMLPGPYRVPAYRVNGHVRLTNKTPCGTYRAPGRFEGSFVRERLIDRIADKFSLDPLEVRRINFVGKDEMPYTRDIDAMRTPLVYDSGDYAGLLDQTAAKIGLDALRADIEARRTAGELVGIGFGFFVEKSGFGPFDGVRMSVNESGNVEIVTGVASVGQGVETVIAQICADTLGVSVDHISVRHGQTNLIEYGMGAFASRITVMTGSATHIAATRIKEKALATAAELLQVSEDELEIVDGKARVKAGAGAEVTLAEIAAARGPFSPLSDDADMGLTAEGWFKTTHMNYPYGMHTAVVRIDAETGGVTVERYIVAYDIGRAINPLLVEGQISGGAAQGIGGALMEAFVFDDTGQPLAASFVDYLIPTATEMPPVEALIFEDAPSPLNPLGAKGAGEAGINAAGGAIASAVDDALQMPGAITELPITPERVRELIAVR